MKEIFLVSGCHTCKEVLAILVFQPKSFPQTLNLDCKKALSWHFFSKTLFASWVSTISTGVAFHDGKKWESLRSGAMNTVMLRRRRNMTMFIAPLLSDLEDIVAGTASESLSPYFLHPQQLLHPVKSSHRSIDRQWYWPRPPKPILPSKGWWP